MSAAITTTAAWSEYVCALLDCTARAADAPADAVDAGEERFAAADEALIAAPAETECEAITKLKRALVSTDTGRWVEDAVIADDVTMLIARRHELPTPARLIVDALSVLWKPADPAEDIDDMMFGPLATQEELRAGLQSHDDWRPSLGIILSFSTFGRAELARIMEEIEAGKVPNFTPTSLLNTMRDLKEHFDDTADMLATIQARLFVACIDASGLKSADVFGREAQA